MALGQPANAARLATTFVHALIPALPISAIFEASRKFLYAQDVSRPPLYAALCLLVSHPLWLELLCRAFGFVGGPLALLVTHSTMCVGLISLCAWRKPHKPGTWPGIRLRRLVSDRRACIRFLTLSLAALGSLSEWIFWEFACFRVGRFGPIQLAANGVAYSSCRCCTWCRLDCRSAWPTPSGGSSAQARSQNASGLPRPPSPSALPSSSH